jgi:hypothetical protein
MTTLVDTGNFIFDPRQISKGYRRQSVLQSVACKVLAQRIHLPSLLKLPAALQYMVISQDCHRNGLPV